MTAPAKPSEPAKYVIVSEFDAPQDTKGSKKLFTVEPLREAKVESKATQAAPSNPAPDKPPADRGREYTDKFKARLTECPTVEAYNDIMGSETVGKNLAGLKANRPELHAEIEIVREATLLRLTAAPPIPERGPELDADEVPF